MQGGLRSTAQLQSEFGAEEMVMGWSKVGCAILGFEALGFV